MNPVGRGDFGGPGGHNSGGSFIAQHGFVGHHGAGDPRNNHHSNQYGHIGNYQGSQHLPVDQRHPGNGAYDPAGFVNSFGGRPPYGSQPASFNQHHQGFIQPQNYNNNNTGNYGLQPSLGAGYVKEVIAAQEVARRDEKNAMEEQKQEIELLKRHVEELQQSWDQHHHGSAYPDESINQGATKICDPSAVRASKQRRRRASRGQKAARKAKRVRTRSEHQPDRQQARNALASNELPSNNSPHAGFAPREDAAQDLARPTGVTTSEGICGHTAGKKGLSYMLKQLKRESRAPAAIVMMFPHDPNDSEQSIRNARDRCQIFGQWMQQPGFKRYLQQQDSFATE